MSYSQVYDLVEGTLLGYLADLTESGAMVISERPIAVGRQVNLQFEVPELPGITVTRLALPALVIWCQPDVSPDFLNIGLEFREVSEVDAGVIAAIIETYEFRRDPPSYPLRPPARR